MPRGARLDAPGTLHHVIVRGIEKRKIVNDDKDRTDFVTRMSDIAVETDTSVYAWALMTNHAHILLRSSDYGLPRFMRRFLSGYAISYNNRHNRHGHLFQNRYKSIICEEEPYFLELVRYIHLNPLRAGIIDTLVKLDRYKWCGHSVIMNHQKNKWQNRDYVLNWFGEKEGEARQSYRKFVMEGIGLGKQPELTGGGLVRSMGGWSVVKAMRKKDIQEKGDDRILGSSEFVSQLLAEAEEKIKYQLSENKIKKRIHSEITNRCKQDQITIDQLKSGSRIRPLPKIRRDLALKLVNDYGVTLAETARQLGVSTSGIAQIIKRTKFV